MATRSVKWILASASPRRKELLEAIGVRFEVRPSLKEEPRHRLGEQADRFALRAARSKARDIAARRKHGIIIGADTIVVAGSRILGKPSSHEDAISMLKSLSGNWHEVMTGLCLIDAASRREKSAVAVSRVHFRRLTPAEIQWYVNKNEHHDKAGAYAIQGYAGIFIDRIEGCYFNIVGFPIATFERLSRKLGCPIAQNKTADCGLRIAKCKANLTSGMLGK
jgi:septum formation protein